MLKKLLVALFAGLALCTTALAAVDLNTANQQQLESLKGIGPEKAKDIIEYRSKNGPFKTTEDIMKVPEAEIPTAVVDLTIVGGKVRYRRGGEVKP